MDILIGKYLQYIGISKQIAANLPADHKIKLDEITYLTFSLICDGNTMDVSIIAGKNVASVANIYISQKPYRISEVPCGDFDLIKKWIIPKNALQKAIVKSLTR